MVKCPLVVGKQGLTTLLFKLCWWTFWVVVVFNALFVLTVNSVHSNLFLARTFDTGYTKYTHTHAYCFISSDASLVVCWLFQHFHFLPRCLVFLAMPLRPTAFTDLRCGLSSHTAIHISAKFEGCKTAANVCWKTGSHFGHFFFLCPSRSSCHTHLVQLKQTNKKSSRHFGKFSPWNKLSGMSAINRHPKKFPKGKLMKTQKVCHFALKWPFELFAHSQGCFNSSLCVY